MGSGRVIGICGSDEKGLYIKELGFDGFINYKTMKNLREELESNCPDGVDVYFDNVGGEVSNDVSSRMCESLGWDGGSVLTAINTNQAALCD